MSSLQKDSPIAIIGAGVFGLSSAIHLARRGYRNITVFDRQPYHETLYDFDRGCDAASADCNKIIRAAYGPETWYQDLTLTAISVWESWNTSLSSGQVVPPGMRPSERLYVNCGNYRFGDREFDSSGLNAFEQASVENIARSGLGHTQYLFSSRPEDVTRARRDGFGYAVDPFNLAPEGSGKKHVGYLDAIGGFVYADKACRFALHLASKLGVRFVLDRQAGLFEGFRYEAKPVPEPVSTQDDKVIGIRTADGKTHPAALTIVACGGWTPTLLPEIDGLCETTAGSIAMVQIPEGSGLRDRFSASNFPVFSWNVRSGENGNLYGFPLDDRGVLKIGYRGTKYTNPQVSTHPDTNRQEPNPQPKQGNLKEKRKIKVRSTPITKWTSPSITGLPQKSIQVIQHFLDTYLPELKDAGIGITQTRLCWYTDSYDNQWVIDWVPGKNGVLVATGGSGHAFKFLPVLGGLVVDRIEGVESEMLGRLRWRKLGEGEKAQNELMKGFDDEFALQNVRMVEGREAKL